MTGNEAPGNAGRGRGSQAAQRAFDARNIGNPGSGTARLRKVQELGQHRLGRQRWRGDNQQIHLLCKRGQRVTGRIDNPGLARLRHNVVIAIPPDETRRKTAIAQRKGKRTSNQTQSGNANRPDLNCALGHDGQRLQHGHRIGPEWLEQDRLFLQLTHNFLRRGVL